jgi:hypothetical protein
MEAIKAHASAELKNRSRKAPVVVLVSVLFRADFSVSGNQAEAT